MKQKAVKAVSVPKATLRGIGLTSMAWLAELGIRQAADLQAVDVFEVYRELKQRHTKVSRNLLYALIGAQENRDWRAVARTDRTAILLCLDEMGML